MVVITTTGTIVIVASTTFTVAVARNNTPKAVHITAFEFALLIDQIDIGITFVFEKHVVDQVQDCQHGSLGFVMHILVDVHGKSIGIRGQFTRVLSITWRGQAILVR